MTEFDFDLAKKKLQATLKPERYEHTIGVMNTAEMYAIRFGEDVYKARIAGLLHDCAKNIDREKSYQMCIQLGVNIDEDTKKTPKLIHQYLGAAMAKSVYGVDDEYILSAIRSHTTGKVNMSSLDKIIYLADFTEPNRDKEPFDGLYKLRLLCQKDLDEAMLYALDISIVSIIERKMPLHKDTVAARNWFLEKKLSKTLEK